MAYLPKDEREMKRLFVGLALLAGCGEPDSGPVPIAYGEDECGLCRMIISEAPFAAEARFGPDRVEKFDDVGCLGERLWKGPAPTALWVADHGTGRLHPIEAMAFVHVSDLKTPMGSGIAAFADRKEADAFRTARRGRSIGLDEIKSMRKP
jgi:copper chaperone NosL